jgi:hypothetical protein
MVVYKKTKTKMLKKVSILLWSIIIIFWLNISFSKAEEETTIENLERKVERLETHLFEVLNAIKSWEYWENKIWNKTQIKIKKFNLKSNSNGDITITPINHIAPSLNKYSYIISPNWNWSDFNSWDIFWIIKYKKIYKEENAGKYLVIKIQDLTDRLTYTTHKLWANQTDYKNIRNNWIFDDNFEKDKDSSFEKPIIEISEIKNNFKCKLVENNSCIISAESASAYKIKSLNSSGSAITITWIYWQLSWAWSQNFSAINYCSWELFWWSSCLIKIFSKPNLIHWNWYRYNFSLEIKYDDNVIIQKWTRNWTVKWKVIN